MEYVSVAEAARYLGITEHAVRQRAQRGTLPSHRRAGKVLIGIEQDQVTREAPDEQPEVLGEQPTDIPREPDENIRFLRDQNARLTSMIESMQRDHAREIQELHVLLQNTQRLIPATTPGAPHAAGVVGDDGSGVAPAEMQHRGAEREIGASTRAVGEPAPKRRGWLARFLFGDE